MSEPTIKMDGKELRPAVFVRPSDFDEMNDAANLLRSMKGATLPECMELQRTERQQDAK